MTSYPEMDSAGSAEFQKLKTGLLKDSALYNDPTFQAVPKSLYYSKRNPYIKWRRPHEISKDPKFVVEKATRFDLDQGALGDCWYIAAAATLATRPKLFCRVVPLNQSFDKDYAGVFRFNFWRYGKWQEVIIDDKLPTVGNKLYFCNNREQPNEFWSALLEKAYAKIHGSYEALEGGWMEDGLVDFSGGIGQRIDLEKNRNKLPKHFFDTLLKFQAKGSMMGSCIFATANTMENVLDNGLVVGHAYSVTKLMRCLIHNKYEELVRLRNPWGKTEWNGAYSDGSSEWKSLDAKTREEIGLVNEEDGEFWMSFKDWIQNFQQIQICHLPPEAGQSTAGQWNVAMFDGKWTRGVSAGGCGNPPNQHLYWTNPQYCVTLSPNPGSHSQDGKSLMVISLMQKYSRALRSYAKSEDTQVPISFDLYKVKDNVPKVLEGDSYSRYALTLTNRGGDYEYCRETSHTFVQEPGTYVIIPSTFAPNIQRPFLLRIYTESSLEGSEMDVETGPIMAPTPKQQDYIDHLFAKYCGSDHVVDAKELHCLLNDAFMAELGTHQQSFDLEACRSLLCMMDSDKSGVLEFGEVKRMWTELMTWRNAFNSFDKDKSGYINTSELKAVFKSVGYNVSRGVLEALIRRYGGREAKIPFDDFVIAMSKVITLFEVFSKVSKDGKAKLTLEKFMQLSLAF